MLHYTEGLLKGKRYDTSFRRSLALFIYLFCARKADRCTGVSWKDTSKGYCDKIFVYGAQPKAGQNTQHVRTRKLVEIHNPSTKLIK